MHLPRLRRRPHALRHRGTHEYAEVRGTRALQDERVRLARSLASVCRGQREHALEHFRSLKDCLWHLEQDPLDLVAMSPERAHRGCCEPQ
jgi:hypothetical protein